VARTYRDVTLDGESHLIADGKQKKSKEMTDGIVSSHNNESRLSLRIPRSNSMLDKLASLPVR
jgi:hypothetical protein